jgi:hypothetical protein
MLGIPPVDAGALRIVMLHIGTTTIGGITIGSDPIRGQWIGIHRLEAFVLPDFSLSAFHAFLFLPVPLALHLLSLFPSFCSLPPLPVIPYLTMCFSFFYLFTWNFTGNSFRSMSFVSVAVYFINHVF